MAFPKICGIETEYGITIIGQGDFNPVVGSSLLINSYADTEARRVRWDFDDESPGRDARGYMIDGASPPEIETHLVNVVLTNGARYYVDHAHPEYSSPEVLTPLEAVLYDRAGELILARSAAAVQRVLPPGERIVVYKNNSDGKGNSYGTHENYLLNRSVAFSTIVSHMLTFFATRQVVVGAGKVGSEHGQPACNYQISARADFFEEEVGLETTLKRPIVNTRDEPHADPSRWRRLHVIVGDANMSEVSTFLKIGTTALVLSMIEDMEIEPIGLLNPVGAMRDISHDPTCRQIVQLSDGGTATAVEIQWGYFEKVKKYLKERDEDPDPCADEIMTRWEQVLTALEVDPMRLNGVLDWPSKLALIQAYRERNDLSWDSPKLRMIDLQYSDVNPKKGLARRLVQTGRLETLVSEEAVVEAIRVPPESTRAYFRGRCLDRFSSSIVAANWDSLVFDTEEDLLQRLPMLDPTRGTKSAVGALLDECRTPAELIEKLTS